MSEARGARSDAARAEMVAKQLRGRGIADERVLAAMAELPREAFIADTRRDYAYVDGALPIAAGQTISQPYVVARMTELLRPEPGDRVLEIGTGSGYQSAVLAKLGADVVSYERQPELAVSARQNLDRLGLGDRVAVRLGDGSIGDPEGGSYDGIIVTAAAPRVPEALLDQLRDGGRMVIPVGPRDHQELLLIERHGSDWRQRSDGPVVFVPLVGEGGYPE
jgi:protein-L-isoaspartate(D-aspartate) O-methyltransferase